jgi:hypothetical protein
MERTGYVPLMRESNRNGLDTIAAGLRHDWVAVFSSGFENVEMFETDEKAPQAPSRCSPQRAQDGAGVPATFGGWPGSLPTACAGRRLDGRYTRQVCWQGTAGARLRWNSRRASATYPYAKLASCGGYSC